MAPQIDVASRPLSSLSAVTRTVKLSRAFATLEKLIVARRMVQFYVIATGVIAT